MEKEYFDLIAGKKVYLTCRQEYYHFDGNGWNIEPNLVSNQEKVDTRMICTRITHQWMVTKIQ